MPDLELETRLGFPAVGIDEVGLGALAGPLVVAGVVFPAGTKIDGWLVEIRDSKKLSPGKRASLAPRILGAALGTYAAAAQAEEIDKYGLAAAHKNLILSVYQQACFAAARPIGAIIDGESNSSLFRLMKEGSIFLDKADDKSLSVAAASIVAKYLRDEAMIAFDERYPGYGWARNKGYGTKEHLDGLEALGPTPLHRRSYAVKLTNIVYQINRRQE